MSPSDEQKAAALAELADLETEGAADLAGLEAQLKAEATERLAVEATRQAKEDADLEAARDGGGREDGEPRVEDT